MIEEKTRCQSSSPVWFAERVKRLTASNFGRLSKLTPLTNRGKLAREMMSGRLVTSSSIAHGLRYDLKLQFRKLDFLLTKIGHILAVPLMASLEINS